jgi:hypothetical protein
MALPLVLAGPIVRYASTKVINVWIATSQPVAITGHAYHVDPASLRVVTTPPRLGEGVAGAKIEVGQNLYIQIVTIKPLHSEFPAGRLIAYDLFVGREVRTASGRPTSILDSELRQHICSDRLKFPTLVLPHNDRVGLRIFYGSCRKTGGLGADAAKAGASELEKLLVLPHLRPNAFFMLGDQIYADDIPDLLLPEIVRMARLVAGDSAFDPQPEFSDKFSHPGSRGPLVERRHFSRSPTGFTVDFGAGGNHLVTFHEYAAAYLICWSPLLWNRPDGLRGAINKAHAALQDVLLFTPGFGSPQPGTPLDHYPELEELAASTGALARLLANTPTYMLWDDHDVTDDWNITNEWRSRVNTLPLGKAIVRNAIANYWLFQAWGNAASPQSDPLIKPISEFVRSRGENGQVLDRALELRSWSFALSTSPRVAFIDTRTKRYISRIAKIENWTDEPITTTEPLLDTALVSQIELDTLLPPREDTSRESRTLIIVTPTPCLSLNGLESLRDKLAQKLEAIGFGRTFFDTEHWLGNPESVIQLFRALARLSEKHIVVISGDVHYSFSQSADVSIEDKHFRISQLTSSGMKNEVSRTLKAAVVAASSRVAETSHAWWWRPEAEDTARVFFDFHRTQERYAAVRKLLGTPDLTCRLHLEPITWADQGDSSGFPMPRSEVSNTLGLLRFFGTEAENEYLAFARGAVRRSRPSFLSFGPP